MMYCFLLQIDVYDFVLLLSHNFKSYYYVGIRKYYYLILCMYIVPINITMIHNVNIMIDIMIECMMSMNECECNM